MRTIRKMTLVRAPMERCFRLSLCLDLQIAASPKGEILAGITRGLIGPGQSVTWQGLHPGSKSIHQSFIDAWRPLSYYREVMVQGAFKAYDHDHHFAPMNDGTRIRDEISFTSKGWMGRLSERMFVQKRLQQYLQRRNDLIKQVAESEEWHHYLDGQPALDMNIYQGLALPHQTEERVYV